MPELRAMVQEALAEASPSATSGRMPSETSLRDARIQELERELADRRQLINQLREKQSQMVSLADLNELRDRTLAALKLGSQSPSYKASKKALDIFIANLQSD